MGRLLFILVLFSGFANGNPLLQGDPVIRGRITDSSGDPLPGVVVSVSGMSAAAVSDARGEYQLKLSGRGKYIVKYTHVGYEPVLREVELSESLVADITMKTADYTTGEVLVSATRAGEKSPLAYTTVNSETVRKQNIARDLPYILSLTPSLVETSEAGNGIGYTSLRIRGTDGSRINVTIDGIPLNDPESQQVFWVDLPDIAASTDNIQVQRGAGTSSNGAGAFGATISLQTQSPDNEAFAEINSAAGSFGTLKNSVSVGSGLLAGRYSVQMRFSDLMSDGYIDRTASDHRSAFISGLYRSAESSFKVNLILGEEHTGIGWWGVPADSLAANRRYNPAGEYRDGNGQVRYYDNESDNYKQNHLQLLWNRKMNENTFLNIAMHYTGGNGYYEEYREDQAYADYGLGSITIGGDEIGETDLIRRKWMDNEFYGMVYSLKYKKGKTDAVFGGGANIYYGDHFGKIIWMEYAGNTPDNYEWYRNDAIKGEFSAYGKGIYSISEDLSVYADLQYRYVGYKMSGIDDDLRDIGQEHRFSFINPKAGIFFTPRENQKTWLSFAVANREPSRADFKEASGDQAASPEPETLYDTELGYAVSGAKASFSANAYFMYYSNQLVPTGELSNVGYPITTNVSQSYRTGIELTAGVKPLNWLNWELNATFSRNRILDFVEYYTDYNTADWSSQYLSRNLGDVDIAYSPSVTATSDLAFTAAKNLNIHFISKYVGKQYFDNTMSSSRMIDPFFVSNIMVDFSPDLSFIRRLDLQFVLNNVFNAEYESNAYGGNWSEDGVEKTWSYYFPQAGINFMTRIGIRF